MKFEDVIGVLDIKDFAEMTNEELAIIVQQLRSVRTDVPETKHRRKKHRSREHLVKQLLQMAKEMQANNPALAAMKEEDVVKMIMQQPQIMAVLNVENVEVVEKGEEDEE